MIDVLAVVLASVALLLPQDVRAPDVDAAGVALDELLGRLPAADLALDELLARLPRVGEEGEELGEEPRLSAISAELGRRLRAGTPLSSEQWRSVLLGSGALHVPKRWLAGEPFAVGADTPGWLDLDTVLVLEPDAPLRRARVGTFDVGSCGLPWTSLYQELQRQELGELAPGRHTLTLRLELRRADRGERWFGLHPWLDGYLARAPGSELGVPPSLGGEPRLPALLSSAELSFEVEVVPTLDEAVPPVSTPELDDAVRRALALVPHADPARGWFLEVAPLPELERVALALDIRLVNEGRVVKRVRACPSCDDERRSWVHGYHAIDVPALTRVLRRGTGRDAWTVRVEGTDEGVLYAWADARWAGSIELSLDELLARGVDRERR